MPYPMGAESLRARAPVAAAVSLPGRAWYVVQELGWFIGFVLLVPVTVLAIGIPIALLVKLAIWLAHAL